ncbi:MAG TPA: hypothetical protein VGU61_19885 [Noviherbaspirillum sp.]|jgi:hypothetical protein|uniref:hypothetical protein n=1 Tax=Noviherbaspirillum sp. TaxID=1926288 RepID=UPI002DDD4287|nr:hypothetical protein [Noviherbaspirillum sp.]HEV2612533.1 hypothetical protein [Noviherbaspirillum sp.]
MPILTTDILYRLSGGAANSTQSASLGGAKSSNAATAAIFDDVSSAESSAGDIEYRCIYVHNNHGSLSLNNAVLWLPVNTPSASTVVEAGLGTSAINATEQTVADENTAPSGVTFAAAATKGAGVALGNIPAGQHRAVWLRRTVTAAAAAASDSFTIRVEGDTAA